MEFIIELILDLLLEGSIEASKSEKVPKPVRYILITLISLFFLAVIGLIIFIGIDTLKNSKLGGIIVISMGVLFLILAIIKFKKIYIKKKLTSKLHLQIR